MARATVRPRYDDWMPWRVDPPLEYSEGTGDEAHECARPREAAVAHLRGKGERAQVGDGPVSAVNRAVQSPVPQPSSSTSWRDIRDRGRFSDHFPIAMQVTETD